MQQSRLTVILGKRGTGKSTRLRSLIQSEPRVLLFDTLHEPTYDAFRRVNDFGRLVDVLNEDAAIFRVAYSWQGRLSREEDFDYVCRAVYGSHDLLFAVEEIDLFCSPQSMPRYLDMIISLGRHRGLSFVCASRRPKEIHPLIRSQANEIISYTQTEPGDLEWCQQVMGHDLASRLPELPPFESIVWRDSAAALTEHRGSI
jgi:YD repeat-containing protein